VSDEIWDTTQVGNAFGRKPSTIRAWIKKGTMVPRPIRGPQYLFSADQVRAAVAAKLARPAQPKTRYYFRGTSHLRRTA
jgi:DNA-binding transcriptional MerR regulator